MFTSPRSTDWSISSFPTWISWVPSKFPSGPTSSSAYPGCRSMRVTMLRCSFDPASAISKMSPTANGSRSLSPMTYTRTVQLAFPLSFEMLAMSSSPASSAGALSSSSDSVATSSERSCSASSTIFSGSSAAGSPPQAIAPRATVRARVSDRARNFMIQFRTRRSSKALRNKQVTRLAVC